MKSGKVILGIMAGLAAGAALGILYAPGKGTTTRKKISKKGDAYIEDLKTMFDEFLETISDKFESAKDDADDLIEKGKSKVADAKPDVKNKGDEKLSTHS